MLGSDFDAPIMYQDLANYTMGPMNIPFGYTPFGYMPGMYPSYLGDTKMRPQPDHDKVEIINRKENETKSTIKKAAIAVGGLFLLGFIPSVRKNIGKLFGKIKNFFHKKP